MKQRNIIILIIVIIMVLLAIFYIYSRKKENNITVTMYYVSEDLEYDIEIYSYKYNKIYLTDEQQKEIIKFYKKTNITKKQEVQLAMIGEVKLEFSDGNIIDMDVNNDSYAYLNDEYSIELSKGFKEYILKIVDYINKK